LFSQNIISKNFNVGTILLLNDKILLINGFNVIMVLGIGLMKRRLEKEKNAIALHETNL